MAICGVYGCGREALPHPQHEGMCRECWYDSLPKPYKCICGKRFPSKQAVAGHISDKRNFGWRPGHAPATMDSAGHILAEEQ